MRDVVSKKSVEDAMWFRARRLFYEYEGKLGAPAALSILAAFWASRAKINAPLEKTSDDVLKDFYPLFLLGLENGASWEIAAEMRVAPKILRLISRKMNKKRLKPFRIKGAA